MPGIYGKHDTQHDNFQYIKKKEINSGLLRLKPSKTIPTSNVEIKIGEKIYFYILTLIIIVSLNKRKFLRVRFKK